MELALICKAAKDLNVNERSHEQNPFYNLGPAGSQLVLHELCMKRNYRRLYVVSMGVDTTFFFVFIQALLRLDKVLYYTVKDHECIEPPVFIKGPFSKSVMNLEHSSLLMCLRTAASRFCHLS